MTLRLKLIIIFMLHFEAISGQTEQLYKRVGEDVLLPCKTDASFNQCADVLWSYKNSLYIEALNTGRKIEESSDKASRLSVKSDCSLIIRNITEKDAGQYVYKLTDRNKLGTFVSLYILSISPLDAYRRLKLSCSLTSYDESCQQHKIIWLDETGTELLSDHFLVKEPVIFVERWKCVSVLTVKHSESNKRFTCQIVQNNKVKIDAVYFLTKFIPQTEYLYHRVGDDVMLPCRAKSSFSSCSDVNWLFWKDRNAPFKTEVQNGKVVQSSAGASRLSMSSNCSLLIRNITDDDAGRYDCQLMNGTKSDASVFLFILRISPSPLDVYGRVRLSCSLKSYDEPEFCEQNKIIWVDETGTQVSTKSPLFFFGENLDCDFVVTVKQSEINKRFTCQFVEDNKVMIDAVYIPTEIIPQTEYLYHRVGDDVMLPCRAKSSFSSCSDVNWLFWKDESSPLKIEVHDKNVVQSSVGASRLSMSSDCSLIIRNITVKDAGRYDCQLMNGIKSDASVFLFILSIFSRSHFGRTHILCLLKRFYDHFDCEGKRIIWVDETGTELSHCNCDSDAIMIRQPGNNKRFTCQFVENNKMMTDAVYIPTGISGQTERLYHRVGDDVVLPCRAKSYSSSCSDVNWLYWRDPTTSFITEIHVEDFEKSSAGASRLSMSSNCSLLIRHITDVDAREYVCRVENENDANVVLNTLSISSDLPEVHPRPNGSFTLLCSLNRYDKRIPCKENSIIWRDERGSHLTGEGVWFEFRGQTNCVSVLTVKHQSGNNKTVTCQFIEDNIVKTDAVYVLHFSDLPGHNFILMVGSVVKVVLMFLGLVAALIYMYRRRTKENEEQRTRTRRPTENDDEDAL